MEPNPVFSEAQIVGFYEYLFCTNILLKILFSGDNSRLEGREGLQLEFFSD